MITARMQNSSNITQSGGDIAFKIVRIDPCNLGCHVSSDAKHTPAQLVGEFERLQIEIMTNAGQKRFQKLD